MHTAAISPKSLCLAVRLRIDTSADPGRARLTVPSGRRGHDGRTAPPGRRDPSGAVRCCRREHQDPAPAQRVDAGDARRADGLATAATVCAAEGHRYGRQRGFTAEEVDRLACIFGVPTWRLTTRCANCGGDPPTGFACL